MSDPQAEAKFYEAYGRAMAKWADFEVNLAHLFAKVTDMHDTVATRVFFSAKNSAARLDMIAAALPAQAAHPDTIAAIEAVIKRGIGYNGTRNALAHEFTWMRTDLTTMTTEHVLVKTPRLIDITTRADSLEKAITTAHLLEIAENFSQLTEVTARLYGTFDHPALHAALRDKALSLAKEPYTLDQQKSSQ